MDQPPDVALPQPRPGPFAAPADYDRVRASGGLATAELPGGALTWLVTRLDEARGAPAAPEFSTDRADPDFPVPPAPARAAGRARFHHRPVRSGLPVAPGPAAARGGRSPAAADPGRTASPQPRRLADRDGPAGPHHGPPRGPRPGAHRG